MKKYELYLDNSKWEQGFNLQEFESWLQTIGIDTTFNTNSALISQRVDIRVKISSRNVFRDNVFVRIHQNNGRSWISCKFRSMDPIILQNVDLNTGKKHTVRVNQIFRDKYTIYEKVYKLDIKPNKVFKTWRDVDNIFPGLVKIIGVYSDELVTYRPTKHIWNLKNSAKLFGNRTQYKLSMYYNSAADVLAGQNGYCCRFGIATKKPKVEDDEWIEQLQNLYHLFYGKIVTSVWNSVGPVRKIPLFEPSKKKSEPRPTREYQIYFDPSKWKNQNQNRDQTNQTTRDQTVDQFNSFLRSLVSVSYLSGVNFTNTETRLLEHYGLDTPDLKLKSRTMDEVVVKMERDVDTGITQLTCKYKGFDQSIVQSFPVRVKYGYLKSSKIEQDYHPGFARIAISMVANVPPETELERWEHLEDIFPGLCEFCKIDPATSINIRLYKVKWEQTKQELIINNYKAIGKISLEYPSIEDARNGTNLFHGQWSFRVKLPRKNTTKEWGDVLDSAYNLYYDYLVPSGWNYEGTHSTPDPNREIPRF